MRPRRGLVWPLLLIILGTVLLAANYGLIGPISFRAVASLWPVILIIVGIDLAVGRRWPLASLGVSVLVIAAAIALITAAPSTPFGLLPFNISRTNGSSHINTVDVPRGSAKAMTLRLSAGAGTFQLRGGADSLVHAESDQDDLTASTFQTGDRIDARVDQGPKGNVFGFGPSGTTHVTMQVASDVPTSLTVDAGAGEFRIDTSAVKITDARLSVGAASLQVVLPHPTGDVPFTISAGASSITIEIPAGVDARITSSGGLISMHSENPRFSGSETAGYATATDRVTVRISAGATSIVIR